MLSLYIYYGCSTAHGTVDTVPPLAHHPNPTGTTGLHSYILFESDILPLYLLGGFIVKFLFVVGVLSYYYYYIYT